MKNRKSVLFIVILLMIILMLSCGVSPSKVSDSDAKKYAEKMTYFKDHRTGICYAVIAVRKDIDVTQEGIGITTVPCELVEDYLVNP